MSNYFFDISTDAALRTDLADYISLPGTFGIEKWKPAERAARNQFLVPVLSQTFIDELLAANTPSPEQVKAIKAIKEALAHLAMIKLLPTLNVSVQDGGMSQYDRERESVAPWWAVRDFKRALQTNATVALDLLLVLLKKNVGDYSSYQSSDQYIRSVGNFVNDVATAQKYVPVIKSHFLLESMRSDLTRVDEAHLLKILSKDLFEALLEFKKTDDDWADYSPLKPYIEEYEINLAFAESISGHTISYSEDFKLHIPLISEAETGRRTLPADNPMKEQLERVAKANAHSALNRLKNELTTNASAYPLYTAPEDDAVYIKAKTGSDKGAIYPGLGLPIR